MSTGVYKHTKEQGLKAWATRLKNGAIQGGCTTESAKKAWETKRKNGGNYTNKGSHWKLSDEHKQNARIHTLNIIKQNGGARIGNVETDIFDALEWLHDIKIIKQYDTGIGYAVDGYCKETNTVYEVYENKHKYQIEHDLKRQKEIERVLKCDFIIIGIETWRLV